MLAVKSTKAEVIKTAKKKFGHVPNLIREMMTSPAVARAYLKGQEAMEEATLSAKDQQVIQLIVSSLNNYPLSTRTHATLSVLAGVSQEDVEAIQLGRLPKEFRMKALVLATLLIQEKEGKLTGDDLFSLAALGVDRIQLYEIIALIGFQTISNYINHIAHTEFDPNLLD
jgi:alkylhydroperoxidase family enzyme